jgi:FtsH-binding integral membrane protein
MLMSLFTSNIFGSDKLNLVIWAVWGFLIILYIMYDFSVIKKSQQYIQMTDESTQKKYVFMFGFMLFINLIQLLWLLLRLFIALKR